MYKAEQDESLPSSSRRELKRHSTEEETEKAVRDNLRGFTETHRTMVLDKEGKSMTGCLTQSGGSVVTRQSRLARSEIRI